MQNNNNKNHTVPPPIKTPRIKSLFLHKTKWRCSTPSDVTSINKYKLKMIKDLEIAHINNEKISLNGIRQLCKALTDAKTITSLAIQKDDVYRTYQTTKHLGHVLTASNRIQKLFLRYSNRPSSQIPDEKTLQSLTKLKKCKNLNNLEIHSSRPEKMQDSFLSCLSSQLRFHNKLKTLHLDVLSNADYLVQRPPHGYDPNASLLQFKYPQCLSSLTITFNQTTITQQHLLPAFISNLQKCKLKSLNLISSVSLMDKDSPISPVWGSLFENPRLESLTLSSCFYDRSIYSFLDSFSHLKNLTKLDLSIFPVLSAKEFKIFLMALYSHLASFPNFKSLTLRVSYYWKRSHSEFEPFFLLQDLKQLENLMIHLPIGAKLEKSHLQSLSHFLHSLRKLTLNLYTEDISFEGISFLLQSSKNISVLFLQFYNANLSNKSIQILFASIAHLPLTDLSLDLGQTNTNILTSLWREKPNLSPLFSALCGFNLLTHLDLNLKAFKLPTAQAKHFSLALKELKQLSELSIILPEFETENNIEGLRSLFESFKAIPKLSSIRMSFILGIMGTEEARSLAENLQSCRSLRAFDLRHSDIDGLTGEIVCSLLAGLKGLHFFKELRLRFHRSSLWKEESSCEVFESLATLKYLESLILTSFPMSRAPEMKQLAKELIKKQRFKRLTYCIINKNLM